MESTVTSDDAGTLRREVERLRADLHRLKSDFAQLGDDAVHAAKAGAAEARERVAAKTRSASDGGREYMEAIEGQVAAHPFASLATAFAVGIVLGLGLSRKD